MRFELYCASSCENENTPVQVSGCGIILIAVDDDKIIKRFEYGLGSSPKFRADLLCVRLALASIKPVFRCHETILYVDNRRIQSAFDIASVDEHQKEYELMMRWYGYYNNISVEISDSPMMSEVKSMANTAMRTQKHREY